MGHCADFYEKWKKNPNWCNKCPSSVFTIEKYLEMIKKLDDAGIPEEIAYAKITENQVRTIPKKRMDSYVPEIVKLIQAQAIKTAKITHNDLHEIHKKINPTPLDYDNRYESPPREKRWAICPACGEQIIPIYPKKRKKPSVETPQTTEKEHERRKEKIKAALSAKDGVDFENFDLNAYYDSTLNNDEIIELCLKELRIPTEPQSQAQTDQKWEDFLYLQKLKKGEDDEKEPMNE